MQRKILIISSLDIWSMGENKGGPSLWHTLKGYADNNWQVFFIIGNKDKNSLYNVRPNIKICRFDAKWLKRLFRIKKIGFFANTLWWLYFQIKSFLIGYKIAKKEKIDVFYAYEIQGALSTKILALIFKKPIVSRFQGTILAPWLGTRSWKIRFWQHVLAFKIPVDLLIMANDGTQGDKVLRRLNVNMNKVKFWMNGVDKNIGVQMFDKNFLKNNLNITKDKKIILTVSRLEKWKRLDRIIKAMPEIIKRQPNVKLLIIGDGAERNNIERLTEELKAQNYILFLGVISHDEIEKYYQLADIFVSLYDLSNVGNPLLEAMINGKCIVTLDVGDTNKFIFNNQNGILLKINELNKLPETIINLLKNDNFREILGENAREFADKNFWTWEKRIKAEIFAVNNLLENDKQRNNFQNYKK